MDGFLWQELGPEQQQQLQQPLLGNGNPAAPQQEQQQPAMALNNIAAGNIPFEVNENGNPNDIDVLDVNNILDGGSAVEGKQSTQCDMVHAVFISMLTLCS